MGDGSAIGGWILAAAVVTVLAGGAGAVTSSSGDSSSSGSSGSSGSSNGTTAAASRSAARAAEPSTRRPRPACTTVVTRYSHDRTKYMRYPANTTATLGCGLIRGDAGAPVSALKEALRHCSSEVARGLTAGNTFDASTVVVLSRAQARLKSIRTDGIYDGETAVRTHYPWYEVGSNRFTGRCSPTGTRVP